MRKSLFFLSLLTLTVFSLASCGKSECKKYLEKFCADKESPACKAANESVKDWSSDKCRIERNALEIDEQAKKLEKELEN